MDRAAAAVGQWLDWARDQLARVQGDLIALLEELGPDAPRPRPGSGVAHPWYPCPAYGQLFGSRAKDAEFMQKRCPVGRGPSSKT